MWGKAPWRSSRPLDLRLFSAREGRNSELEFNIENCPAPSPQPLAPFFGGTTDRHEAMGRLFGIMAG